MERDPRRQDRFLRLQIDAEPNRIRWGAQSLALRFRGLTERYDRFSSDSRLQGEGNLEIQRGLRRGAVVWVKSRLDGRLYPKDSDRNYHRASLALGFGRPLRGGWFALSPSYRALDFRRTPPFDRRAQALTIDYRRPIQSNLEVSVGSEFEWSRFGSEAFKKVLGECKWDTLGRDRRDRARELRVGVHYTKILLLECGLTWKSIRSNTFGFSVGRKRVEAAVSGWLPGRVLFHIRGRAEATSYHDRGLDVCFLAVPGDEQEAREDNNSLLVRMRRPVRRGLALEGRVAWFKNESLLVGSFYRKVTATVGLSWAPGSPSDF